MPLDVIACQLLSSVPKEIIGRCMQPYRGEGCVEYFNVGNGSEEDEVVQLGQAVTELQARLDVVLPQKTDVLPEFHGSKLLSQRLP